MVSVDVSFADAGRVDRRIPDLRGRRRIEPGRHRRAAVLADAIVVDRELGLLADLPDDPRLRAVDVLRIDARRAVRVEDVGRQRIEVERARRQEEPDPVLLDRPAERGLEVGQLVDAVGGLQAARLQLVGQVVGLEALVLIAGEEAPVEACCRRLSESC